MQVLYDPIKTIERIRHIVNELSDQDFYEECSQLYFEVHSKDISDEEVMYWMNYDLGAEDLDSLLSDILPKFDRRCFDNERIDRVNARKVIDTIWTAHDIDQDGILEPTIEVMWLALQAKKEQQKERAK